MGMEFGIDLARVERAGHYFDGFRQDDGGVVPAAKMDDTADI